MGRKGISLLQRVWLYLCVLVCVHAKSIQSHPTLCDPMDCSLPGFSAHGILQARILKWVAVPSSRGSSFPTQGLNPSLPCPLHWQAGPLPLAQPRELFASLGIF